MVTQRRNMYVSGIKRFNPYLANVENRVSSNNASRWQMGFNSGFKGLRPIFFIMCTFLAF